MNRGEGWFPDPGRSGFARYFDGSAWSPYVACWVDCLRCGASTPVPKGHSAFNCGVCHGAVYFVRCKKCGLVEQRFAGTGVAAKCSSCGELSYEAGWRSHLAAVEMLGLSYARFAAVDAPDPYQRVVAGPVQLSSGIGGLVPGSVCVLRFGPQFVGLQVLGNGAYSGREFGIPYAEVDFLDVGGAGTTSRTTDARIVGGGFGLEGALKGMAMAAAANALTRRTSTTRDTAVRFKSGVREILMQSLLFEPHELRYILAPSFVRIQKARHRRAQLASQQYSPQSVEQRLRALDRLLASGLISETEFGERRARILDDV